LNKRERKHQAIDKFREGLLQSSVGDKIARLILFGSVLRGETSKESDIDLLVVAIDELKKVEETGAEISFDILLEIGEGVEPLVYCLDQVRYPESYFVYRNARIGREIYRMDEREMRKGEARGYSTLAEHYLEVGERLFGDGEYRVCSDVAYNSAELAAKGLLLLKIDELPSSHRGVVNKFGELYVKSGEVNRELGRKLNDGIRVRNKARYESHAEITEKEALEMIKLAKALIGLSHRLIVDA
jgi:uncharacterized protein (UPF0332 family)/predicted nucleotidyltransferase